MKRIQKIIENKKFRQYCRKNEKSEKGRRFCRHNFEHFADVARIAEIYNLEHNLGFERDIIYAAALLHDIGKWMQYIDKTPHNEASAQLAQIILKESRFKKEERAMITDAILTHREYDGEKETLNYILFFADKKSRQCFRCKANNTCNWDKKDKNNILLY